MLTLRPDTLVSMRSSPSPLILAVAVVVLSLAAPWHVQAQDFSIATGQTVMQRK